MPFKPIKLLATIFVWAGTLIPAAVSGQDGNTYTRLKTVVIDPGHGGHDPGCISSNKKYQEKNITLSVALKLGALIREKYPQVKVIYTRSTDKFVELGERAAIANRNKADLFISIHVNATRSPQASGTETWVMGTHKSDSNFELCKTENSVITLESNYESKYEGFDPNSPESYIIFSLLQNTHLEQSLQLAGQIQRHFRQGPIRTDRGVKQGGLIVLWKSTMPAVLVELGFLSNPKDYNMLINKDRQSEMAASIFAAFQSYKQAYENGAKADPDAPAGAVPPETSPNAATAAPQAPAADKPRPSAPAASPGPEDSGTYFCVQILSVNRMLKPGAPDLKGRKDYICIPSGNLYKYGIGRYATREEAAAALPALRKTFPGAFIIRVKDGKIVK